MSEFAPKPIQLVERCSAMRAHLQEGLPFKTDLFCSLTRNEPSSRLAEVGITELKPVDEQRWLVKVEFEENLAGKKEKLEYWYRVTLDEHSQRVPRPYHFTPIATMQEVEYLNRQALRFAEEITTNR